MRSQKRIVMQAARIFGSDQAADSAGILGVFQGIRCAELGRKDRRPAGKALLECIRIKRERGELAQFTPLMLPFRL